MKYNGWFWLVNTVGPGGKVCTGVDWLGINCDEPGRTVGGGTFGGKRKLFAFGGGTPMFGWVGGIDWQGGGKLEFTACKPEFIGGNTVFNCDRLVFNGGCVGTDAGGGIGLGGRPGPMNGS